MYAKQSTAKSFLVGPILDADGAAKTDEVVASIKVTKNGSVGAPNGSSTLTHNHTGHYVYAANANDFDTLGEVVFSLNSGTNAMSIVRFQVLPANVYDSLVSGSDYLDVNAAQVEGSDATDTIQSSCDDALVANHLDHLLKTDYDPSSKPGVATALLNEIVENDGGVSRFTQNALEQAPDTTTGIELADDAITAAKFDESTAYPVKSADTGATQIARVGADGDTLEDLSDEIAAMQDDVTTIAGDVENIDGDAMRGTDGAATAAEVVTALLAKTGWTEGGTTTIETLLKSLLALTQGKITKDGDDYTFFDDDGLTELFTLTIAAGSRTPS